MSRSPQDPLQLTACAPLEAQWAASWLAWLEQPARWQQAAAAAPGTPDASAQPWATYWATRLDAALPVQRARQRFEAAAAAFQAQGQRGGQLLCLAAIIEGFYVEEGSLAPLDGWVDELQPLLPAPDGWPSDELQAQVLACGVGIRLRAPAHPLLARWADDGALLMRRLPAGTGKLKLATFLGQYHLWRGELGRASLVIDALPGVAPAGLPVGERLVWLDTVANFARYTAQHARARQAVDEALALAGAHRLQARQYALHAYGASVALAAHDLARAATHVQAMRPPLEQAAQADQTHYWHYLAGLTLLQGDAERAVALARTALQNSGEIGGPTRMATHSLSLGQALLRGGEPWAALDCFDTALGLARSIDSALLIFTALLMRSACLGRLDRRLDALPALREGWGLCARRDLRVTAVWWLPEVVAEVAQAALQHGIETEAVRRFVRSHRLPCSDPGLAQWPWALGLRSFGEFQVTLDGQALVQPSRKTAQRPLDLLRALLAQGSTPLPVATAMQWLWPDAEGPAQRKAFDAALLRLRRLLGQPPWLHLEGGRLWLDPQHCWSDVAALQHLLQRIDTAADAPLDQLRRWAAQLLALMAGPFLGADDAPWVQGARARYSQRFVLAASQLAAQLQARDAPSAIALYERALDAQPLAESLSRRLMRLHAQCGDRAEALRAWRHCCVQLRAHGGLGPAPETRALALELGLGPGLPT